MFERKLLGAVLLLFGLVMASGVALGQAGTSTIRGTVSDPQGLAIASATVALTDASTGFSRSQSTSNMGRFSFDLIPPGDYTLTVEATGFRKKVMRNVHALVGSPTEANVQLDVGSIEQVVQVEGAATELAVNTQDATLGNNFIDQQIAQLPLEARDVSALLTLQPAVTRTGYVAGARSDQSNITLDGIDINEAQTNALDSPVVRLNSEAIQEFRVTTVGANANQGRSSAAQVNMVTKTGSNAFHGALFEYHRNTIFTANDFFNNRSHVARPKLIRNTFSGELDGPIIKNKLFFMYSYEGRRDASQTSVVRTVPLPSMGQGQLRVLAATCSTCPPQLVTLTTADLNSIFPVVGINPAAVAALGQAAQKYPVNDFTVGDSLSTRLMNTAGYRFNASTPVKLNSHVATLDWNISSKQSAFVRANVLYDHSTFVGGLYQVPQFPDTPAPGQWSHPTAFAGSHTWTLGGNLVNNVRYGYTRQAFSNLGDTSGNNVTFRFVFLPRLPSYTLTRTTPVHNLTDDLSWVKGNHTVQFGTNIRFIANSRMTFANSFDTGTTNPSGYQQGGNVVSDPIAAFLATRGYTTFLSVSEAQNAGTALIGRLTGYSANYIFGHDGSLQPVGTPSQRTFATQGYDFYVQDAWKVRHNLTLSYGLRYALSRPVYETHGFEVKPNIPLSQYLQQRADSAAQGIPFNAPISLDLSGPANGKSGMYPWDLNNFQPRVAVAWSPDFENSFLTKLFGKDSKSVIRAGFAMSNDYYGEALATFFDLNNTLGFSSQDSIPVNTYNVTTVPAPLFAGFGQDIRGLPRLNTPTGGVKFPLQQPSDMGERIESTLDSALQAPTEYTWNLTFERQLPAGLMVQASYIGRAGRHLLAQRDVMQFNDLVDPKSGMDWYTAATTLEKIRQTRPPANTAVAPIPYFENIFPANLRDIMSNFYGVSLPAGFTPTQTIFWIARNFYSNDWTDLQADLDLARFDLGLPTLFVQPQYAALSAWGTVGNSNYNALALSVRQRYHSLQWDFNYTYSHSLDDASGLQNAGSYGTGAFILNALRQQDFYANSGFDVRHQINVNGIYQMPFGRGHVVAGNAPGWLDRIIGGWQLSGIMRWNTGLPRSAPIDDARWATNFQVQSFAVLTKPLDTCVTRDTAKLFGCNPTAAYQSFRNPYPGESGMRNVFRLPGYIGLDAGLAKAFAMPWKEGHKLELRWEVFNVPNIQHFGDMDLSRSGWGIRADPAVRNLTPPTNWSNFIGIQGTPRVMQVGLRYSF